MRRERFDWWLILAVIILLILSLTNNAFLVPEILKQQIFYIVLGFFVFFIFFKIDLFFWEKTAFVFYFLSLVFLILPLFFGFISRGASRWLRIGSFSIQPAEIVKPFLIIFFAWFFSQGKEIKRIFLGLILILIPFFLIFFQPDLGSAVLVLIIFLGILLAAEVNPLIFLLGGGGMAVLLPLFWKFLLHDYQKERILGFLNPYADPTGRGYNLIQSIITVGSGGLLGRGLGRGTQTQLRFLPEFHTDFAFASLAESFGFVGVCLVLGFWFLLFLRILKILEQTENRFAFLFLSGAFFLLFAQFFINIGMNMGLLPVVGIPLPFISYGGSSFLTTMIILGIIENICYNKYRYE